MLVVRVYIVHTHAHGEQQLPHGFQRCLLSFDLRPSLGCAGMLDFVRTFAHQQISTRTPSVRNPEVALSPVPYSPSACIWCESFFWNMRACSLSPFRRFNSLFFLFDLHAAPCSQRPTTS